MNDSFFFFVLLFFTYSVIGYMIEIISVSRIEHKLVLSRGYLIGPYLPIFGVGAIVMIALLYKYQNDIFALFSMSLFICCILEYLTSYVMEKIFHLRWWDYSNKKLNINGRVCLENGIFFGIGGVVIVRYFNPLLLKFLLSFPKTLTRVLGIIIFIMMFSDFLLSTYTITQLKIDTAKYNSKDSTSKIRKEVMQSIEKYRLLHKRTLKAFPNIKNNKNIDTVKKFIEIQKEKRKKK